MEARSLRGRWTVVVGAVVLLLGVALPSAQSRTTANEWAGTWSSNWGTMTLTQSGSAVTGTYTHDSGHLTATASGLVLSGTWDEAPTRKGPKDAGPVKLTMSPDLRTFSGPWSYADGTGGGTWTGTRTSGPPTTTTTTPTTTGPSSPPVVRAYPVAQTLRPGTYGWLPYSVKDESGKAKVRGTLFEGGASVLEGGTKGFILADGRMWRWKARLAADLKGPLFFCVWAENPAGRTSAKAPKSSCAFLSFLVDVDRVSNNCGGSAGGDVGRWAQNLLGNTSTFRDPATGKKYTVDFSAACDLHDAGYGGHTVQDRINGGVVDYHAWSRERVDRKFQEDMQRLCRAQIPAAAKQALSKCLEGKGRYRIVRTVGHKFFDADLMKPGIQQEGPRDNS